MTKSYIEIKHIIQRLVHDQGKHLRLLKKCIKKTDRLPRSLYTKVYNEEKKYNKILLRCLQIIKNAGNMENVSRDKVTFEALSIINHYKK